VRIHSAAAFLLVSSSISVCLAQVSSGATPSCADLHVIPAARECNAVRAVHTEGREIAVLAPRDKEDEFTAEDLRSALKSQATRPDAGDRAFVRLERADGPLGKELLQHNHLAFDPAMHDEGYIMVPDGEHGLAVIAETASGIFYGAQTVKQLVRGSGKETTLLVPTVRDWPVLPHRGLSDDWSRGPLPNMDFLKREIRTLAAFKYNIFSPYFENTFAYTSTPVAAFPGGAMTPDEARELVAYAAQYHITIIPEQESFGHLHNVLKYEQYSPLGETPHGAVLAPGDPGTLPLIASWFHELAQIFPGPYAHIGADETFDLGLGRTRQEVQQQGLGKVYLSFLTRIHDTLEPEHKQLLFWGDIAVNSPDLVPTLPKDMIAVPWEYDAKPDFTGEIVPFTKAGLETWVAPGVNNWSRMYPNNNEAMGNIGNFVRDGQRLGAKGMLNTVWNDDGEGIFDMNWFGVLFGAAAAWQPAPISDDAFLASFGLAFHGDPTGKIDDAQREMIAAQLALKGAGLEDAEDNLYWVDPFSPNGQAVAAKIRPVVSQVRLHAERVISLVDEARAAAAEDHRELTNPEALDALELGARRIDAMGLKFQAADEAASLYARAQSLAGDKKNWNEVEDLLETIGSNNGKLQDIRDGYTLIGTLYRQAWLRGNRPYWLANNMEQFSRAAQLWIGRGDAWDRLIDHWWSTHTLPAAAEAGLPQAPAPAVPPAK
jgi:hexosaminidase